MSVDPQAIKATAVRIIEAIGEVSDLEALGALAMASGGILESAGFDLPGPSRAMLVAGFMRATGEALQLAAEGRRKDMTHG